MCQRVHAGGCGESFWQRVHELGVNNCNRGDVIGVDAHHLFLFVLVDYDVVDSGFGCGACCCRQCHNRYAFVFCGSATFKRHNVVKLGVVDYYADAFCGIHSRAAAYCYYKVGSGFFEAFYACFYIGHGRVWLDVAEYVIGYGCFVKYVCDHFGYAELYESFVGHYKRLDFVQPLHNFRQYLSCARSEVRYFV